jgi:hypothetical protein
MVVRLKSSNLELFSRMNLLVYQRLHFASFSGMIKLLRFDTLL